MVSIPAGFSDALRPGGSLHCRGCHNSVSIPAGFSDALRLMDQHGLQVVH